MCERAGKPSSDLAGIFSPVVQFDPPDIARRYIATWNGVQTDTVEVVRREPFEYGFRSSRHLLIMSSSQERAKILAGEETKSIRASAESR